MNEREKERMLADCLEEYHRRKALGVVVEPDQFEDRLGDFLISPDLAAMSHFLDFTAEEWKAAIEARVPKKSIEINLKAFELGRMAAAS